MRLIRIKRDKADFVMKGLHGEEEEGDLVVVPIIGVFGLMLYL